MTGGTFKCVSFFLALELERDLVNVNKSPRQDGVSLIYVMIFTGGSLTKNVVILIKSRKPEINYL